MRQIITTITNTNAEAIFAGAAIIALLAVGSLALVKLVQSAVDLYACFAERRESEGKNG